MRTFTVLVSGYTAVSKYNRILKALLVLLAVLVDGGLHCSEQIHSCFDSGACIAACFDGCQRSQPSRSIIPDQRGVPAVALLRPFIQLIGANAEQPFLVLNWTELCTICVQVEGGFQQRA